MSAPLSSFTLAAGTLSDHAAALAASMARLQSAAANAAELLVGAGFPDMLGSTVDDLRKAMAVHSHLVQEFDVKVRTSAGMTTFKTHATDAASAADAAVARNGDSPCGVTVTPADPDLLALVAAHRTLGVLKPLDAALDDPSIGRALRSYARRHPVRRAMTDFKSLAANDRD